MAAWRMIGLISFKIIRQLCGDCYVPFMPGDPVDSKVLDAEVHKNLRSERMKRIHSYIRKGDFANAVVTLCVASIPRWSLARCIESERNPEDEDKEGVGFNDALERCAFWSRNIISGQNTFIENLLYFAGNSLTARLYAIRSIHRKLMYVGYRNRPFCSTFWD